jgi:Oxidoreductase family, C-terminal alpha/beta domain
VAFTRSGVSLGFGHHSVTETHAGELLLKPKQQEFLESLRSRRRPFADVETGHKSTIPVLLANIAYKTGRKLKWDSQNEKFVGDEEANQHLKREYRKPWHL